MNFSRVAAVGDPAELYHCRLTSTTSVDSKPSQPVLDVEGTLARLGGDHQLFTELAGYVLEDLPSLVDSLCSAIAAGDGPRVRGAAHAIKGLVAGCGGIRAAQVAQTIESAGQSGDVAPAAALLDSLRAELEALTRALRAHQA